jgi:hypothetical protein
MDKVGIFYGHFEYNMASWNILWPFGNLVAIWYIFPRFGIVCQEKSGNHFTETRATSWTNAPICLACPNWKNLACKRILTYVPSTNTIANLTPVSWYAGHLDSLP